MTSECTLAFDLFIEAVAPILERMKQIRMDAAGKILALRGKKTKAARN
jgi:hypothetical protein